MCAFVCVCVCVCAANSISKLRSNESFCSFSLSPPVVPSAARSSWRWLASAATSRLRPPMSTQRGSVCAATHSACTRSGCSGRHSERRRVSPLALSPPPHRRRRARAAMSGGTARRRHSAAGTGVGWAKGSTSSSTARYTAGGTVEHCTQGERRGGGKKDGRKERNKLLLSGKREKQRKKIQIESNDMSSHL